MASFRARILCDSDFIEWLLKQEKKAVVMKRLMHIKNSKECEGEQNVILDFDFNDAIKLTKPYWISAAFKQVPEPAFLDGDTDKPSKRIIYSIWLANKPPYMTYIFTCPENKKHYEENKHFKGMSTVSIKSGDDAVEIINTFYKQFELERMRDD